MSRVLLNKDNITVIWEVGECESLWDINWNKDKTYYLKLTFTLLVNGKQKVWSTSYNLKKAERIQWWDVYELEQYYSWNDTRDLLSTIWYDLSEVNIWNWIEQFYIN